jgi:DNA polymerase III subunit epsilon
MTSAPATTPSNPRLVVIDVETSGLSPRRHRILQIAAIEVDPAGNVVDEWNSYVRPRFGRVGPTEIHGLTAASLRDAPAFRGIAPTLAQRLGGAVVIGHNVDFDWEFVRRSLRRVGVAIPPTARFCTLELSRSLDPERLVRHRLSEVCARNGVELTAAHDARNDALATALVLPHLLVQAGLDAADLDQHRAYRGPNAPGKRNKRRRQMPWSAVASKYFRR